MRSSFSSNDLTSSLEGNATPFIGMFAGFKAPLGLSNYWYLRSIVTPSVESFIKQSYGNFLALAETARKTPKINLTELNKVNSFANDAKAKQKIVYDLSVEFYQKFGAATTDADKQSVANTYTNKMATAINNLEDSINSNAEKINAVVADVTKRTAPAPTPTPTSTPTPTEAPPTDTDNAPSSETPKTLKYGVIVGGVLLVGLIGYMIFRK